MNGAGFDIGGANIKFASTNGHAQQVSFPIWKKKNQLAQILGSFRPFIAPDDLVGVTMTAELADCFEDKKSGVEFIVSQVQEVFEDHCPLYYRTDGLMCTAPVATENWRLVAASNWHAISCLAFDENSDRRSGFVFDIGSTTTDIIPVRDGTPVNNEQDDLARLSNGQLYYGGIGRTPVCGLIDHIELDSGLVSIANELFATTKDAFIWRNELPTDESDFDTADGRSSSRLDAGKRLARMLCADLSSIDDRLVDLIAAQAKQKLCARIVESLKRVVTANPTIPLEFVTFGAGAWLAEEIAEREFGIASRMPSYSFRRFSNQPLVNQTAAALAVAINRQQIGEGLAKLVEQAN